MKGNSTFVKYVKKLQKRVVNREKYSELRLDHQEKSASFAFFGRACRELTSLSKIGRLNLFTSEKLSTKQTQSYLCKKRTLNNYQIEPHRFEVCGIVAVVFRKAATQCFVEYL